MPATLRWPRSLTQTVVEPHMTTINGVLSMLYFEAATRKITYVNGGLNRPLAGLPGFSAADLRTGRGPGVPGWWPAFEASLERHGSKPKTEIAAAAIHYARDGFEIHPFLYASMFSALDRLGRYPEGREIYMPEGSLLPPGATLEQTNAARTLERLVAEGEDYWRGEYARKYSEVVQAHNGVITPEDFERYQVRWMEPARGSYRGYELVGSPPPDNGGTHIIEALHMIELLDLERLGPPSESPDTAYQMIRIAHEVMEEGANQTDPASHEVPLDVILSKEYARMRFKLLQMAPVRAHAYTPSPGSTHVTAVDAQGNVATILHSTMASAWSAGLFVEGVSIVSSGGHFLRVMPKPGDRASAYVAPTMVLRSGRPVLASGSPSVSLVANILQNTVNVLDFGMAPEESTHRPRFGRWRAGGFLIEADLYERMGEELEDRGLSLNRVSPWYMYLGSWEGIVIDQASGTYHACGDPRRTGHAEGV